MGKRYLYEDLKGKTKTFHGIAPVWFQLLPRWYPGHTMNPRCSNWALCLASLRKTTTKDWVTFQNHLTLSIEAAQILSTGLEFWGAKSWPKVTDATQKHQALGTVSISTHSISHSSHPRLSKSFYRLIQICWVNINSLKNGLRTFCPNVSFLFYIPQVWAGFYIHLKANALKRVRYNRCGFAWNKGFIRI